MGDPDQMVFKHTARWLLFATILLLLMGLGLVAAGFLFPLDGKPGARPVLFAFGLLIALSGAVLTFGRLEKIIDRRARTVTDTKAIFGLKRTQVYSLGDFVAVRIKARGVFSPGGTHYGRLLVVLGAPDYEVYLTEYTYERQARAKAEEVAEFLKLPVVDMSRG